VGAVERDGEKVLLRAIGAAKSSLSLRTVGPARIIRSRGRSPFASMIVS
jgi:hypothetical protein